MAIIAIIFAAIIFFTVNGQCNLIYRRENNLNDKGMLSKHTAKTISAGMPMKQKRSYYSETGHSCAYRFDSSCCSTSI